MIVVPHARFCSRAVVALAALVALCAKPAAASGDACLAQLPIVVQSDRPDPLSNSCVVDAGNGMLEGGYYQNASAYGQTQLAAWPLVRVRYGIARQVELFVDPADAVAKAGPHLKGFYTSSPTGVGAKWQFIRLAPVAFAIRAEASPQAGETETIYSKPTFATGLSLTTAALFGIRLSASTGALTFAQIGTPRGSQNHGSLTASRSDIALHFPLAPWTQFVTAIQTQSRLRSSPGAQTRATLSLRQLFTRGVSFDVNLGSAFNRAGGTKAHYLGAGFVIRP